MLQLNRNAVILLHTGVESAFIDFLKMAYDVTRHMNRKTLHLDDIELILHIREKYI